MSALAVWLLLCYTMGVDRDNFPMPTPLRYGQICIAGAAAVLFAAFVALDSQTRELMETCKQTESLTSCELRLYGR